MKTRKRSRKNPEDATQAAAKLSEQFHGRPARRITVHEEQEADRAVLTELGRLLELHVLVDGRRFQLPFHGTRVKVAASPDGKNLFLVGGDQALQLASLGIKSDKDFVPVGPCTHIVYRTKKAFHNFDETDYVHEFGEEGGTPPLLGYSVLNQRFYFEGGTYTVKPEGIVN